MIFNAKQLLAGAIGAVMAMGASTASAAPFDLSYLSLTYTQQTGTAAANETIDFGLTISLSANAPEAFTLKTSNIWADVVVPEGLLPTNGGFFNPDTGFLEATLPYAEYTSASASASFYCTAGSFLGSDCASGPYTFNWVSQPKNISLAPGESTSFTLITFTPKAEGVPPGEYSHYVSPLTLNIYGLDEEGRTLFSQITLIDTPYPSNPTQSGYYFSRTITAVPEPQSIALLLGGLAVVGFMRRKAA